MEYGMTSLIDLVKIRGVEALGKIAFALVIVLVGWLIARIAARVVGRALDRSKIRDNRILIKFVMDATRGIILIFTLITALGKLGIDVGALIAGVGVAGFVIGFAFRDSLSNFAAGLLLVFHRPFRVDNFVEAGGAMGIVREINILTTVLRTPDNKEVIIPNSKVWGEVITNFSAYETRRMEIGVGISYDADIPAALKTVKAVLEQDERILKDPAPFVGVVEYADSSINLVVRPWVPLAQYWDIYFDLHIAIKKALDDAGIEIPFPQRVVHMKQA